MCRRMLPLNALRSFEVAARHRSLTKAADELNVTPSAVHYQIKALEDQLGIALFRRQGRHLELTDAAEASLSSLEAAFDLMTLAYEQLRRFDTHGTLTISVCPSFAAKWLMSRFEDFYAAFPDIDVRVSVANELVDFSNEEVDLAIHYGNGDYAGLNAERLTSEEVFPVCSPHLEERVRPLDEPRALAHHTLLHDESAEEDQSCPDWDAWLRVAGITGIDARRGPRFNSAGLVIDAALAGRGIALARRSLVADDLTNGRLVRPFELSMPVAFGYWVVCPQELADHPKVAAFREWLFARSSVERARDSDDRARPAASGMLPQKNEAGAAAV